MASTAIEKPDNNPHDSGDEFVIDLPRGRTVTMDRQDIENPTLEVLRVIQDLGRAGSAQDMLGVGDAILALPDVLHVDTEGWRSDDLQEFSAAVMGEYARLNEATVGESSGSGE